MRVSVFLAAIAGSCITLTAGAADSDAYVQLPGKRLDHGRTVWLANCEGCHGYGFAGAPVPMQPSDWLSRIEKGRPVLYEHAINGFFGADDTMMPERGGNPELTDEEVMSAVDYMAALAEYYIQQER